MKLSLKFYESKTFWFNIAAILTFVISALSDADSFLHLGPQGKGVLVLITGVINLALRLFSTSKPIEGSNDTAVNDIKEQVNQQVQSQTKL